MVNYMNIYMIGIKGAGMSALANILLDDGYLVRGLDKDTYIHSEDKLLNRGVIIDQIDSEEYLNSDIIIIGHSFKNEKLIKKLDDNMKPYFEYHEFLSYYLNQEKTISIAGSHGKTTLTKMLAQGGANSSYLIGDGSGKKVDKEDFFFLESCEYQEHFLIYNPKEIIITNIDYDHVDYFKDEINYIEAFNKFCKKAEKVYCLFSDSRKIECNNLITYGLEEEANYSIKEEKISNQSSLYKVLFNGKVIFSFNFNPKPYHFLELLLSVIAFYHQHNYDLNIVINKLSDFNFPYQRFNVELYKNFNLICDYSHHPSQIKYNLELLNFYYTNYPKVAIFRPDRTSRLIYFKDQFIEELNKFDYAFVLPLSNTEDKQNHSSNELESGKIIAINSVEDIKFHIPNINKCCFSFMSSKNLKEDVEKLKSILDCIN